MADADPFTSNGTCYYASGKKADPAYIPCGNEAFGIVPCCQAGDYCLSNNACFNNQYGNVYLAGCTSGETYNNEALCPRKYTLAEQQWVGMVRCFESDDKSKSNEVWQGCHESLQPLNTIADPCTCTTGQSDGLYTRAPPDLPREALLPTKIGGHITFASGFGPSNTKVTATSKVNLTELTVAPPDATPVSSWITLPGGAQPTGGNGGGGGGGGSDSSNIGLSTGAKVGIGIGVALGGISMIAILWCLFRLNQRFNKTNLDQQAAGAGGGTPGTLAATPMSPAASAVDYQNSAHPYAYGQLPAESPKPMMPPNAYAHPSELEGSHYQTVESELPADNHGIYQAQMVQQPPQQQYQGSPSQAYQPPFQGGDPHAGGHDYHRGSDAGSVVSSGYGSPHGTEDPSGGYHDARNRQQVGGMGPIHEMNG